MEGGALVMRTAKEFLQLRHFIIMSALLPLLSDSLARESNFSESQALLLQIGQGYFVIQFSFSLFNILDYL